jgi:hypothetical protein
MTSCLPLFKRKAWRRRMFAIAAAVFGFFLSLTLEATGAPANTLRELFAELNRCLVTSKGEVGSELTVVFSLRRDGGLLGRPRISFSKLAGNVVEQHKFAKDIADAFDRCLPVSITDALGGAIAGRPMSMRFVVRPRETNT